MYALVHQLLSNVLALPVERAEYIETSALGAAYLAGLGAGIYKSLDDITTHWQFDVRYEPQLASEERNQLLNGWHDAVKRVIVGSL